MTSAQMEVERYKASLPSDAPAHRIIAAFKRAKHYQRGTSEYDLWRAFLRFSDSTMELIASTVESHEAKPGPEHEFPFHMFVEYPESSLRSFMVYLPQLDAEFDNFEATEIITGLTRLERFKDHPQIDALTGEDFDIAVAFLKVTSALYDRMDDKHLTFYEGKGDPAGYIGDISYQDLIVRHYRQADAITDYIRERGISDLDAIKEYLDNGTALNTGVL